MEKILCSKCKNYISNLKCFAFPNGIPNSIATGKINGIRLINNDHSKPLKNQKNDITFEEL